MSIERDIERELEIVVDIQTTKGYLAGKGYSLDQKREQIHEEFASWLVNKFYNEEYYEET